MSVGGRRRGPTLTMRSAEVLMRSSKRVVYAQRLVCLSLACALVACGGRSGLLGDESLGGHHRGRGSGRHRRGGLRPGAYRGRVRARFRRVRKLRPELREQSVRRKRRVWRPLRRGHMLRRPSLQRGHMRLRSQLVRRLLRRGSGRMRRGNRYIGVRRRRWRLPRMRRQSLVRGWQVHRQCRRPLRRGRRHRPFFADTWEWDGNAWSQREVAGPTARTRVAMLNGDVGERGGALRRKLGDLLHGDAMTCGGCV
jgi:hypothetical protein